MTASKLSSGNGSGSSTFASTGSIPSLAAVSSAMRSTSAPTTSFPSRKLRVNAPVRQPRSRIRFPGGPRARRKNGIRSGT